MTGEPEFTPEEEAEIVLGSLPFTIDGNTHHVPELKWRANRAWQTKLQDTFTALATVQADTPEGNQAMVDAQRELVLAYDATGALGDLEDATDREIIAIYDRLMEVSFPQASSQTALLLTIIRRAVESALASSTSSPSPTGTSEAPTILKDHLPSAKSRSSSARRRTASAGNSATA